MDPTALKAGPPVGTAPDLGPVPDLRLPETGAIPKGRNQGLWRLLVPLASLRLTVFLFVLALVIVFYGTLAQVDLPNWTAIRLYFRSILVWIPARVLLLNASPETMQAWGLENTVVPFPGGWLIGGVMFFNLLAAHVIHFKLTWRRSGVLMIHAGLILMMLSELIAGIYALEGHMQIVTGSSSNFLEHNQSPEIAITRPTKAKKGTDDVAVVPKQYLHAGSKIDDARLPFNLTVLQYMPNSNLIEILDPAWTNPATTGQGLDSQALERPEISGTDTMQTVDVPSAYVQFTDRATGKELGTLLLSVHLTRPQTIKLDNKDYDVSLRFKRSYKDYNLHLKKFVHDKYIGTETPKDFRSYVRFTDPSKKIDREIEIYMNHPFRYEGETFFQSGVLPDASGTILQVVRNPGWTLPYLSCLIVGLGMLLHFGLTLTKFVNARAAS